MAVWVEGLSSRPEQEVDAEFLAIASGVGALIALVLAVGVSSGVRRLWLLPFALAHIGVFLFTLAWMETALDFHHRVVPPIIVVGAVAELLALLAVFFTQYRPKDNTHVQSGWPSNRPPTP